MRFVLMSIFVAASAGAAVGQRSAPLAEAGRAALPEVPEVECRLDHLAWDAKGERLFVAALGHGSVEVLHWRAADPSSGRVLGHIPGLAEPQGIVYLQKSDELVFTTGGDGKLHVHDATSLAEKKSLVVGGDADNVRVDEKARLLYVGCQDALAVVDMSRWEQVASVALAGHAESFQIEPGADGEAARIFVNVPDGKHVAVVDAKAGRVVAKWEIGDVAANYPMALAAKEQRLFVGCRTPPCLLLLDTATGKQIAKLPIGGDCDDLWIDAERGRVMASCGSGVVSLLQKKEGDHWETLADVPTGAGARTSLFLPERGVLFVAVPKRDGQRCELRLLRSEPQAK